MTATLASPGPPTSAAATTARGGGSRWFWPALATLWIVWAVRASVGYRVDLALDPTYRFAYSNGIKLLLWAVPAAAFARWLRRESPLLTLRLGLPAPRRLPAAVALIAAYLTGVGLDIARKHGVTLTAYGAALAQRGPAQFARGLPSAFAEEVLFRGLVLTELTERWRFWPANLVSGVIFVSMHWSNRVWQHGLSPAVFADAPALLLIALALGWVVWRTGSIWPAVVFHAANNTLTGIL